MSLVSSMYSKRNRILRRLLGGKVVFHHVPKCAGTSVSRAFRKRYFLSQQSIAAPLTNQSLQRQGMLQSNVLSTDETLRGFRMLLMDYFVSCDVYYVGGHVAFSEAVYDQFSEGRAFVTVLRDPVERFMSEYFYNKARGLDEVSGSLDEFLETGVALTYASRYSEYFCGKRIYDVNSPESYVEDAIRNLTKFSVVGFTDDMAAFRDDVKQSLGVTLRVGKENARTKATHEDRVSEDNLNRIKELCQSDTHIFRETRKRRGKSLVSAP